MVTGRPVEYSDDLPDLPAVRAGRVLGALVMRAAMIALGAALIAKFSWIIYVFGAFLILTGIKMVLKRDRSRSS